MITFGDKDYVVWEDEVGNWEEEQNPFDDTSIKANEIKELICPSPNGYTIVNGYTINTTFSCIGYKSVTIFSEM